CENRELLFVRREAVHGAGGWARKRADAHEWIDEILTVSNETTAKGTGLAKIAGKEDPVELDSTKPPGGDYRQRKRQEFDWGGSDSFVSQCREAILARRNTRAYALINDLAGVANPCWLSKPDHSGSMSGRKITCLRHVYWSRCCIQ
ncbi:unnamed protein product, partial [Nippostrongylus brasiliensis]|uniref:PH domain-containing protein n=1 Tax=Nippostrongylus brasiliensis TaxID=27835 RepID=A0A0N4XU98_NIPBR